MKIRLAYGLLWSSLLITGCETTTTKDIEPSQQNAADAQRLLSNAELLNGPARQNQILAAAKVYLDIGDARSALETSNRLQANALGDALYAKQTEIQSRALLQLDNIFAVKGLLENPRLIALLDKHDTLLSDTLNRQILDPTTIVGLRQMRAQIYTDLGEPALAIRERVQLGRLLGSFAAQDRDNLELNDSQINQELIWFALMDLDLLQLTAYREESPSKDELGWYQLAIVSKNNQRNINQQYNALKQWQAEWSYHPANRPLPADLALIAEIIDHQPKRIALLLPLSGDLALISEAIRDGFMASFFTTKAAGGQLPEISIYDVSQGSINEIYDFAVSQGAEVVVGPLSKEHISELALRLELPVPTLALNHIEPSDAYPAQLFQLGLGIEDEALQTAQRAFADGMRTALIFAPSNAQGDRASQIFAKQWEALGGVIVGNSRYNNEAEVSQVIERAMHLDASKRRARELRAIVGRFEFEPRRRQDIDMIFLVAQPRQGRQINPLFAFHYASDIPIYSTSSIYEGISDKKEVDLDGIIFSNLPWFFQNSPEKEAVLKGKTMDARSQRLYALGVDAYYLYPRLKQLETTKRANFWGQTGVLSLTDQRQFSRSQQWGRFTRGIVKPLVPHNEGS